MVVLKNPLLIAFEKVVEHRTVHAAADQLKLTQAALTKRIRLLESQMKLTLFLRSRSGMILTHEGRELYQYCKIISEAEGQLLGRIKGKSPTDVSLTVAGTTSAISGRVNRNCLGLYKKFPYLKLNLQSEDHGNLVDLIKKGIADLAVVTPNLVPNEMDSKVLKPDRYLLVASAQWQARSVSEIIESERIIDFYESDLTTIRYLKKFSFDKIKRHDRIFVNENEALVRMIIAAVGYGTLTEEIAKPYIESGELIKLNRGQIYEDPLALVWYPRHEMPEYFKELIRAIK